MKQKIRLFQQATFLLIAGLLVIPVGLQAQQGNRKYPDEVLASRIIKLSKDYKANIIYNPGQNDVTVPELVTNDTDVTKAMKKTLASTGFTFIVMADKSIVVKKGAQDASGPQPEGIKTDKGKGSLSGTVLDEKQEPVIGATVMIVGTTTGTATDANGSYKLSMVDAGTFSVRFSFISYETLEVSEVTINPGKSTRLDVVMKESSEELNEVVVTANYKQASTEGLYARQKSMVAMADGISADQIKKTSDNNLGQVLKRVAGVTVNDGKYATIRGMSERYNNVELNGSSLPSTEPNRRNFSFDVIPSALVDNVLVSKTFTPDMPGEFVGGVIQVNTLAVPDEKFFTLTVGSGFNTVSTGKDFWTNTRFKSDYFFGNKRDWYGKDWVLDEYNQYLSGATVNDWDAVNAMNAKIPNRWGLEKYTGAPTQNYSLTIGVPFNLGGGNQLGVVAAFTYRHEENAEDLLEMHVRAGGDTLISGLDNGRYKFMTATGAVLNIGWKRPGHAVTWRNLFNNRFTHTNSQRIFYNDENGVYNMEQFSAPLNNRLWQTQLEGAHQLFGERLAVTWMADYNKLDRDQPEDRLAIGSIRNEVVDGVPQSDENGRYMADWGWGLVGEVSSFTKGNIMFSDLSETKKNAALNLEVPFTVAGVPQKLKTGYRGTFRESDYEQQILRPQINDDDDISGLAIHEYYAPENFANGILYLIPRGIQANDPDFYKGEQDLHAGYLMAELNLLKKLHLTGGVRMERNKMQVHTTNWLENNVDTTMVYENTDWLPSVTGIYNIRDNLNFRASYSKTLARPDFRELSPCLYYNVDDRVTYSNLQISREGGLKQTRTDNVDLRVEWYPNPGEVISFSAFYKKFKNPIETIGKAASDLKNYTMVYVNLEESESKGLELNIRKSFGFINPFLRNLYLTANGMIMEANLQYNYDELVGYASWMGGEGEPDAERDRPLQGLSPYTLNAGLSYEGSLFGAAINYGRAGRKLMMSAIEEKEDEYEAPRDVLDVQLSARLLKGRMEIKANVSDLLNQDYIIYRNSGYTASDVDRIADMDYNRGDWVLSRYKKGTSFSLSVSYTF